MQIIDLRSDTLSLPTAAMRQAMATCAVGNEAYGEDPTVLELEQVAREITGLEDALLVSSGKMGNLVGLLSLYNRGEGVLIGEQSHLHIHECRGISLLTEMHFQILPECEGRPLPEQILAAADSRNNRSAPAAVLCLENTHNYCGGLAIPVPEFSNLIAAVRQANLRVHLDGARIFNAAQKWGVKVSDYTAQLDSVQICLTKSLCAPFGSLLCGSKEFIRTARTWRARVGGAFRQIGFAAAAGLLAMREMPAQMPQDNHHAELFRAALAQAGYAVIQHPWSTNMVFCQPPSGEDCRSTQRRFAEAGIRCSLTPAGELRFCFYRDIDRQAVAVAIERVQESLSTN